MENVYFFEEPSNMEVEKALSSQEFRNLRKKMMDCRELGSDRKGYFLYLRGRSEFLDRAEGILRNLGVEKLMGDEQKRIIKEFTAKW